MDYNPSASLTTDTQTPDALVAGDADSLVARKVTLITGQNVVRGTVLGKITASGKYNKSLSAASDGSEVPDLICAQDCDATSADADCLAFEAGRFNSGALTLGTAHTVASIKEGLRVKGIYLVTTQPA
jgi:hypothetical protein